MHEMYHKPISRALYIELFYPKFSSQIDFNYTCIMSSTTDDMLGPIALLVSSPIADTGVMNLIMALILEIDHEIFSSHSPPSADSRRVFVSYERKYVH